MVISLIINLQRTDPPRCEKSWKTEGEREKSERERKKERKGEVDMRLAEKRGKKNKVSISRSFVVYGRCNGEKREREREREREHPFFADGQCACPV